ncbi:hypothetical protein LB22_21700 [Salmonella enterica subsp. enterica serovar Potsdam]|nr:hypothetical protein [Salmonella enterica subsp. enterica serovar Potsdam]
MKDLTQLLSSLKRLMVADHYPLASPVAPEVLKDLICNPPPVEWADHKKSAYIDIQKLIKTRLDYAQVFNTMDGFEYNGLTFYNLVQAENENLLWSNIYIRNFEARDNEIYVDPNLTDKVLIGEDGMSLFAYSFADDCFQIRDKASTDYVIESHTEFDRFLSSLIQTVS